MVDFYTYATNVPTHQQVHITLPKRKLIIPAASNGAFRRFAARLRSPALFRTLLILVAASCGVCHPSPSSPCLTFEGFGVL